MPWYLLRPLNPTVEDQTWLKNLTHEAPFTCGWQGLDYCEALVAEFPAVVDYFLFDGKGRLDVTIQQYLAIVGFQRQEGEKRELELEPADSRDALASVHEALNAFDPFYRYDFAVADGSGGLPDVDLSIPGPPGLVASVTSSDGYRAVTFHIFERFKDATLERPIPGIFTAKFEPGTPEAEAWGDFVKYGLPVEGLPLQSVSVDLPGGLGVSDATEATAWIGSARRDDISTHDLTLKILSPDGELRAEVLVRTPAGVGGSRPRWNRPKGGRGVRNFLGRVQGREGWSQPLQRHDAWHLRLGSRGGARRPQVPPRLPTSESLRAPDRTRSAARACSGDP